MRVPWSWLRGYCDPGVSAEELAERLAMTGTEVERVGTVGPPSAEAFVVGRVLSVEKHPKADRLSVCTVDTGDGERTIVCGAPNVAAGQTVPVALPGAVLPGGHEIGEAKLRGVRSAGMICSSSELGLGESPDGILVLAEDHSGAPYVGIADIRRTGRLLPGTSLSEVLPIAEPVLELEVTPNRVDCFGVYGVAREVHAISAAPLGPEPWAEDAPAEGKGEAGDYASVEVEVPELCPRFTARVFTDVEIGPSPAWLQARLTAAGQRPINNVVDITNYVMLLTAQPLHAFDLDRVPSGALTIRTAAEGEKMTTLDGEERSFDAETVLVCDAEGPSGIAGIMGGQRSEVADDTSRVLLEVANWNGTNILRTSRMLGLRSEASSRFEKQLHPELCMRAQRIASKLMVELCGAKLVPGTIDVAAAGLAAPPRIVLRGERVEGLLGMEIPQGDQVAYLERLGFGVEVDGEDLGVTVPPDRHHDVTREVDLIEEVARVHGLDEHLPTTLPATAGQVGGLSREQRLRRRAEDAMRDLGFDEVVGWSFTDPGEASRLRIPADDPRAEPMALSNPLSEDQSVMRTTLLGSLLDIARRNLAHGADRVALFESGRVYLSAPPPTGLKVEIYAALRPVGTFGGDFPGERTAPFHEPHRLGGLAVGSLAPPSWRGAEESADFFALKSALEALAGGLGVALDFEIAAEPFLHPGRAASISIGGVPIGWLGELHPLVCREWDMESAVAFELELAALLAAAPAGEETYEDVTTFPAVHQDIAVVVRDQVSASQVREAVLTGGGELLASAQVFDLYEGEQLGEGRKSLALRLEFRAADRTLTDEEVAGLRESIVAELEKIGGTLRE
jgi:phenylalanyl-tRNA synthetase beta chain